MLHVCMAKLRKLKIYQSSTYVCNLFAPIVGPLIGIINILILILLIIALV